MPRLMLAAAAAAVVSFAAVASAQEAGTASATFDRKTGNFFLDLGADVGVVGFDGGSADAFVAGVAGDLNGVMPAQDDGQVLAYFSPTGLPAGGFELGAFLAPGTGIDAVGFSFTPVGGTTTVAPITVVPEPALIGLAALAVPALVRRR